MRFMLLEAPELARTGPEDHDSHVAAGTYIEDTIMESVEPIWPWIDEIFPCGFGVFDDMRRGKLTPGETYLA